MNEYINLRWKPNHSGRLPIQMIRSDAEQAAATVIPGQAVNMENTGVANKSQLGIEL